MNLARIIGSLWATRKVDNAAGATLQIIQPLSGELERVGQPIIACDTVGAGPGELVFYVTAYEAVIPFVTRPGGAGLGTLVPMDAAIVGIVEQLHRSDDHMPDTVETSRAPSGTSPPKTKRSGKVDGTAPVKKKRPSPPRKKSTKRKASTKSAPKRSKTKDSSLRGDDAGRVAAGRTEAQTQSRNKPKREGGS
jgi:ethanolamine utilization protein EutN